MDWLAAVFSYGHPRSLTYPVVMWSTFVLAAAFTLTAAFTRTAAFWLNVAFNNITLLDPGSWAPDQAHHNFHLYDVGLTPPQTVAPYAHNGAHTKTRYHAVVTGCRH